MHRKTPEKEERKKKKKKTRKKKKKKKKKEYAMYNPKYLGEKNKNKNL